MPDKYGYAKQKLYEAVLSLAGVGSIQERLTFAAVHLVTLSTPAQENPPEIRAQLEALVNKLTVKPLSDTKSYTPRELNDEEARKVAEDILSLFVKVMGGL